MATFKVDSLYRYNVRDPADPMLNSTHLVESYKERFKPYLSLREANSVELKNLDLPQTLLPNCIYIVDGSSSSPSGEHDQGEDMTLPEYLNIGVRVYAYESIPLLSFSGRFLVLAHQYVDIESGDIIAKG